MKYLFYILIFTLISCSSDYKIKNSFVVYEAFLSKLSNSNTSTKIIFLNESKPLYIKNLSLSGFYSLYRKEFPTLTEEAIEDFLKKNEKSIKINWKSILTDIRFISKNDIDIKKYLRKYTFKEEGAKFYIEVSQVGFSKDKQQAIFSFYQSCGVLCGSGGIVHFKKINNKYWFLEKQTTFTRR